jgi:hypothetical protein
MGGWKGSVPARLAIETGTGDCSHGPLGKRVDKTQCLLFGSSLPLTVGICSGTQQMTDDARAFMTATFGAAKPPSPV